MQTLVSPGGKKKPAHRKKPRRAETHPVLVVASTPFGITWQGKQYPVERGEVTLTRTRLQESVWIRPSIWHSALERVRLVDVPVSKIATVSLSSGGVLDSPSLDLRLSDRATPISIETPDAALLATTIQQIIRESQLA